MTFGKCRGVAAGLVVAAICVGAMSAQALSPQQAATAVVDATVVPDVEAGAEMYSTECRGCHSVSIAPTLRGVLDRPVASVESFSGYSEGLKAKKDLTWTHENLDAFLTDPLKFAPGTLMVKAVADPQTRANIVAYIETLPPPR